MFRKVTKLLTYNFKTLIKFEFIYKMLSIFICSPIITLLMRLCMKLTGYKYLTIENIISFIKEPITIGMIIFGVIVVSLYTLFEINTIIIILDASRQKVKVGLRQVIKISLAKTINILKNPTNIGLIFIILFLIPFLNLGVTTSFMSSFSLPEFIMDFIKSNPIYLISYLLLNIILAVMLFRWIYAINFHVLDNLSFYKGRKLSVKLSKNHVVRDFIKLIFTEALIYLSYIIFIVIGITLIIVINNFIKGHVVINSLLITIIWLYLAFSFALFMLISTPISYAAITYLFYKHKEENNMNLLDVDFVEEEKPKKKLSKSVVIIILLLILSGTYFTYGVINGKYNLNIESSYNIEVTAHRGASKKYPENTMSAFKGAKKLGADWVELDVQQTKDKEIIVIHDSNLKRITGVNKNVWELNYNEIAKLDAGSHFDKKYKDERIPLLKDVILWAKENGMKLNIELKPTGHETNFEKQVIDIINEYNYRENVVLTSQTYSCLEKSKKVDKKIKTIYVMSLAYGNVTKLKYADGFSIEATNITDSLVYTIHSYGKEIFAWTINTDSNISKMIDLNVDNIITDDITYAKKIIEENKTSNIIKVYVKFIKDLF